MLRAIPLGCLGLDERQEPLHDVLVVSATVEVHSDRHLVNGLEGNLGHLIHVPVAPFEVHLACVKVMKRCRTGERFEPPCQALVMERDRTTAIRRCHATKVSDTTDIRGEYAPALDAPHLAIIWMAVISANCR